MSVAIVIDREDPGDFYICVSAESSYESYWCPAIEALGLKWAPYFQSGCYFEKEDWPDVSHEICLIRDWILNHLQKEEQDRYHWFCRRFEDILSQVEAHFRTDGSRLYIGKERKGYLYPGSCKVMEENEVKAERS